MKDHNCTNCQEHIELSNTQIIHELQTKVDDLTREKDHLMETVYRIRDIAQEKVN